MIQRSIKPIVCQICVVLSMFLCAYVLSTIASRHVSNFDFVFLALFFLFLLPEAILIGFQQKKKLLLEEFGWIFCLSVGLVSGLVYSSLVFCVSLLNDDIGFFYPSDYSPTSDFRSKSIFFFIEFIFLNVVNFGIVGVIAAGRQSTESKTSSRPVGSKN